VSLAPAHRRDLGKPTLTARSPLAQGEKVDILAQAADENAYKVIATVATTAGGAYSYAVAPAKKRATRRAQARGIPLITSAAVAVKVRPRVGLRRLSLHHFKVSVTRESLVGKYVVFQRYIASTGKWRTIKSVQLKVMVQTALRCRDVVTRRRSRRA